MQQTRFRLRLRHPDLVDGFKGLLLREGRAGEGGEEGRGGGLLLMRGGGRKGRGELAPPSPQT